MSKAKFRNPNKKGGYQRKRESAAKRTASKGASEYGERLDRQYQNLTNRPTPPQKRESTQTPALSPAPSTDSPLDRLLRAIEGNKQKAAQPKESPLDRLLRAIEKQKKFAPEPIEPPVITGGEGYPESVEGENWKYLGVKCPEDYESKRLRQRYDLTSFEAARAYANEMEQCRTEIFQDCHDSHNFVVVEYCSE